MNNTTKIDTETERLMFACIDALNADSSDEHDADSKSDMLLSLRDSSASIYTTLESTSYSVVAQLAECLDTYDEDMSTALQFMIEMYNSDSTLRLDIADLEQEIRYTANFENLTQCYTIADYDKEYDEYMQHYAELVDSIYTLSQYKV